jgi:uncharacterized OB-fold protein
MSEINVEAMQDVEPTLQGAAAGTECDSCRSVHLPARWHRCLRCGSKALTPTRVELRGVFESWALPHTGGADVGEWALGLVKLDAGPMLTVRVRISSAPMTIGARVVGATEHPAGAPARFWFEVLPAPLAADGAPSEVAA